MAEKDKDLDDDKVKVIIEGEDDDTPTDDDDDKPAGQDDDKPAGDDDDDDAHHDDDDDDAPNDDANAPEGETLEEKRERRRQERKEKREYRKAKDEEARRELRMLRKEREELANRLAVLERKTTGSEMAQIDNALEETVRMAEMLKENIREATEANDGVAMAEATDRYYRVQRRFEDLNRIKQAAQSQTREREQRSPIDPTLRRHAESWMSKNSWYDPAGTDADSRVALTVDNALAAEGWDPRTPEYWDELSARLTKYLPHRMKQRQNTNGQQRQRTEPRTTTSGSGRDGGGRPNGSGNTFKLSAERVQAMKDAGIWEDTEARNKMIAKYRAFDKESANAKK